MTFELVCVKMSVRNEISLKLQLHQKRPPTANRRAFFFALLRLRGEARRQLI